MADKVERSPLLKKVLGEISDKVSSEIIVDFNKDESQIQTLCSWGSILVDNIAPLVKSRLFEIYGKESSGKSSLAISACANVIKKGGIAAYIDVECAFNMGFAEALGLNLKDPNFVLLQPDCEEEALAAMIKLAQSGIVDLICLDSTNALVPKNYILDAKDKSDELSEARVGLRAKILNNGVSQLVPICKKTGTTCIFISQLRDNISMFGGSDVIGSGRSLAFFTSARISVNRIGRIEGELADGTGRGVVAIPVKVQCTKNKIVAPFRTREIEIVVDGPNKGINLNAEWTQAALSLNVLKKDNRGLLFAEETPLFPNDTPIASSLQKLNDIFTETKTEEDPYYWVKKEIILRTQEKVGQITSDQIEEELGPIYEKKTKENEWSKRYFELASSASSSSKVLEAKFYIDKAYKYNPFDKQITQKYNQITKKFESKSPDAWIGNKPIREFEDVEDNTIFKMDVSTGEVLTDKEEEQEEPSNTEG